MINDSLQNNKKRISEHGLVKDQPNEFPRQGNENPPIGLVGNAATEKKKNSNDNCTLTVGDNTLEKEGEIMGRDIHKRVKENED
ncbi:MAG TPA: hypothetical protein VHA09_01425 [Nitrososphaera sp.]|nr:hypothetical protein [Nitrososphaera sp.]